MGDIGFMAMFVAVSAAWGGLWWWLLWRIAKWQPVAESHFGSQALKGLGLFIGIGLPAMSALTAALYLIM